MILSTQPAPVQAEGAVIYLTGLFMYRDEPAGDASALAFLQEFDRGAARFDDCTGSYRMRIVYPDGREVYFSDNGGIMRWYIGPRGFRTTLREAAPDDRTPNYPAIAQFLYYGCAYGEGETVLQDVRLSSPNHYYVVEGGKAEGRSKGLAPFERPGCPEDALARQMRRLSKAISGEEGIACTITGGIDSRTILAHMVHNGLHPLLDITGKLTDADVIIAKKVAGRLGQKLLHVPDNPEKGWIEEAIQAADGMTGVCGIYRLYKKARRLQENKIVLECGGLNGEMYKNSFINQDYPFYGGKPDWKRFLRLKVAAYDFPLSVCGDRIAGAMKDTPNKTLAWLRSHTGKTKAGAYLSAGYEIIQGRCAAVISMNSRYYVPYTPLMERNVAAPMFLRDPYSLEMQSFQREQVSTYCPAIKDIETDRGLTCDSGRKRIELLKSTAYLAKVGLGRVFLRSRAVDRIDTCFQEGLSSPQYRAALERCKALGIIAPQVEKLPAGIADRVFALGTIL